MIKKIIFLFLLVSLNSCYLARSVYWNYADTDDYKKFPSIDINTTKPYFFFNEIAKNKNFYIPEKFSDDNKKMDFEDFLELHETTSFLIIKSDTIVFEKYFSEYSKESIFTSFSVSKSFVSALMGIAIDQGYIKNTNQKVSEFLPWIESPGFENISIENLLNMRSGIDFEESYSSPFALMLKFYYGKNLKKYIKNLKIKMPPGQKYEYQSVNTELLSLILEKATGKKITTYLEENIWQPLGMEYNSSWSVDSKKHQTVKAFCGVNARIRDYAKFGRLYLNKGVFNDKKIISEDWINRSTSVINDSKDGQGYSYTYQWRVTNYGAFFAKGFLGQYIYVYPQKNIIIIRTGNDYGDIDWAEFSKKIIDQI